MASIDQNIVKCFNKILKTCQLQYDTNEHAVLISKRIRYLKVFCPLHVLLDCQIAPLTDRFHRREKNTLKKKRIIDTGGFFTICQN